MGIDGGGTHTRIAAVDTNGNVLSYVEKGSSCLGKDLKATENVRQAIIEVVAKSGYNLNDVIGLAAGVAGYDDEEDLVWVKELTRVEGLECPCWHVNDSVVAHVGAFLYKPGIIAISGTGAIVFGITEEGKQLNNYKFHHYTWSTARHLSYNVVHKIIAGETDESDNELIQRVLEFFDLGDIRDLRDFAANGFVHDRRERDKLFGDMGPLVTEAARNRSKLAMSLCDSAVNSLNTGIRLIGSCFSSGTVPVVFIGSVINSTYINQTLKNELGRCSGSKNYTIVDKALPSVLGAVIMAVKNMDIPVSEQFIKKLSECSTVA